MKFRHHFPRVSKLLAHRWYASYGHPDHGIVSDDNQLVAMVTTDEDTPQDESDRAANARLIAAAPKMLDFLCTTRNWMKELCDLIQAGQFSAAEDWVDANIRWVNQHDRDVEILLCRIEKGEE